MAQLHSCQLVSCECWTLYSDYVAGLIVQHQLLIMMVNVRLELASIVRGNLWFLLRNIDFWHSFSSGNIDVGDVSLFHIWFWSGNLLTEVGSHVFWVFRWRFPALLLLSVEISVFWFFFSGRRFLGRNLWNFVFLSIWNLFAHLLGELFRAKDLVKNVRLLSWLLFIAENFPLVQTRQELCITAVNVL